MDKIYNSIIESLIFSSDEPINSSEILKAIKEIDGEEAPIKIEDIDECVNELNGKYSEGGIGFNILKIANGYVYATRPESAKYVGFLSTEKSKRRLSQAALETLAIIAYKQPITKPEIESIRGVNSDYIMNMLLEKELITITGRAETLGRPLLYGTTNEFLKYFGLFNLSDLPKPREIEEIMQDEYFIEQKRKIMMNALEDEMARESGEGEDEPAKEENDESDTMDIEFIENAIEKEENQIENVNASGEVEFANIVTSDTVVNDEEAGRLLMEEGDILGNGSHEENEEAENEMTAEEDGFPTNDEEEEVEIDDDENDAEELGMLDGAEEQASNIDNEDNLFGETGADSDNELKSEDGEDELNETK